MPWMCTESPICLTWATAECGSNCAHFHSNPTLTDWQETFHNCWIFSKNPLWNDNFAFDLRLIYSKLCWRNKCKTLNFHVYFITILPERQFRVFNIAYCTSIMYRYFTLISVFVFEVLLLQKCLSQQNMRQIIHF